jgi:hypothetical protein
MEAQFTDEQVHKQKKKTWNSALAFPILSRSNESTTYICNSGHKD